MAKPALLAIDDDPEVLRAISRDLKRKYGGEYRVLQADSGATALEILRTLKLRNEPAALLLADQRMPHLSGTEVLARAVEIFPDAKRVLLTAYADTDAAIMAINQARINYYLLKPWHPPEDMLFPTLDDLLDDWRASYKPTFDGLRLVGHRWSPEAHILKMFLARNRVPYQWLDVETSASARGFLETTGLSAAQLPMVLFQDGSYLEHAAPQQVAEKIGLKTRTETKFYDLIIVGAGPAGLAAAVYGASEGLRTLLIERQAPGGQAGESSRIENYLGFPVGLSGAELARRATTQAQRFGTDILCPQEVVELRVAGPYRNLILSDGTEVSCHALLIATGVSYRRHDAPGMSELAGAGVYYGAAATEANSFRGQDVFIVGGGNSAGQAAMFFSHYARTVTIVIRGASLAASMSRYLIDQINATPNIDIRARTHITEAQGNRHLERLVLLTHGAQEPETVDAAGVFVFIGAQPHTDWLDQVLRRDVQGFILTGADLKDNLGKFPGWPLDRDPYLLETSVPGIFAAGDVRKGSMKRVASGVGEGAMAVSFIHQHLASL